MCGDDGECGNRGTDIRLGIGMMVGRGAVFEKGRGVKGEQVGGVSKLIEDRDSECVEVGNKLVEVCSVSFKLFSVSVSVILLEVLLGGWLEKGWLSSSALLLLFLDICLTRSLAILFSLILSSLTSPLFHFYKFVGPLLSF